MKPIVFCGDCSLTPNKCGHYNISARYGCADGKPRTNADRNRSMTDEELADFLQDIANLGGVNGLQKIMTWIEWLKEEVKHED